MNEHGVCTRAADLPADANGYHFLQEPGEYRATLKFRTWGERMRLRCYFIADDGQKFYINAWRRQGGPMVNCYCPRDNGPDFEKVPDGTNWLITMKNSRNGNVFWSAAEQC